MNLSGGSTTQPEAPRAAAAGGTGSGQLLASLGLSLGAWAPPAFCSSVQLVFVFPLEKPEVWVQVPRGGTTDLCC